MESQSFTYIARNKEVRVTLSFPIQPDKKAEQEFTDSLKEIYLNKIQIGSMQSGGLALQSPSTDKNVSLDATKEEKSHE